MIVVNIVIAVILKLAIGVSHPGVVSFGDVLSSGGGSFALLAPPIPALNSESTIPCFMKSFKSFCLASTMTFCNLCNHSFQTQ